MRALCLLRSSLTYRRDAFLAGLTSVGCELIDRAPLRIGSNDVVVMWNRYGGNHELARDYEQAGGKVIVVENGHLGKSWNGKTWFAMALNHHAGAGTWPYGGPERWDAQGAVLGPWREGGSEYVVFAQRGIGEPDLRSPPDWADHTVVRFRKYAPGLRLRVRAHPGTGQAKVPLEDDLKAAVGVIAWHSAAALTALSMGVPVWYDCPSWLGRRAGRPLNDLIAGEPPWTNDALRLEVFRNVAWAMWTLEEIADGLPFRHLLRIDEKVAV